MDIRRSILNAVNREFNIEYNIDINNYLTVQALENNLTVKLSVNTCEYCIDGDGNWKTLVADTNTEPINTGHILSFRGNLTPASSNGIGTFTISKKCNLKGNCMSMLYGDNAVDNNSVASYGFQGLFTSATSIISAADLQLPATTINTYCYRNMFQGCSGLVYPPKILPAKSAKSYCYYQMFAGCKALVETPILSATTLASYCYNYMFNGCSKLTKVSDLPAKTVTTYSYSNMFKSCTSLVDIPNLLFTSASGSYACTSMFEGCTKIKNLPSGFLGNCKTLGWSGYGRMFYGCTSLEDAPEILPATTLTNSCYQHMFYNCSKLKNVPQLPATTLIDNCYRYMFYGCKAITESPVLKATTLTSQCYLQMFYNCTNLTKITMLATDVSASRCLSNWVSGITTAGTFVKNASMNDLPTSASGIPSGWTIEDYIEN